jgi:sigma-B regulation protein RsbU (phosphoserine phosphatase)
VLTGRDVTDVKKLTEQQTRVMMELETAKAVQETLMPVSFAKFEHLEVAGLYEPATECAGDWWYYCQSGDKYYFCVGDVTGHGLPAALITCAVRAVMSVPKFISSTDPKRIVEVFNEVVFEFGRTERCMTLFVGCYDPKDKSFTYCNGAHESPFLIRKGAEESQVSLSDLFSLVVEPSELVGRSLDSVFKERKVYLGPGDQLVFYTDGIYEVAEGEKGVGTRGFERILVKYLNENAGPQITVNRFKEYLTGRRKVVSGFVDDVTFFVVKIT